MPLSWFNNRSPIKVRKVALDFRNNYTKKSFRGLETEIIAKKKYRLEVFAASLFEFDGSGKSGLSMRLQWVLTGVPHWTLCHLHSGSQFNMHKIHTMYKHLFLIKLKETSAERITSHTIEVQTDKHEIQIKTDLYCYLFPEYCETMRFSDVFHSLERGKRRESAGKKMGKKPRSANCIMTSEGNFFRLHSSKTRPPVYLLPHLFRKHFTGNAVEFFRNSTETNWEWWF